MGEVVSGLTATGLSFRMKRAEEFARQWRINAKRLQTLASNPKTPASVRTDALGEARTAAEIVGRRADDLAGLTDRLDRHEDVAFTKASCDMRGFDTDHRDR